MSQAGTAIGRYVVERLVTATATHQLYRARDPVTGNSVAIKQLQVVSASRSARLHREATALQRLDHPAVVRYLDHGSTEDHGAYLAMEWLDGEDLKQRLARGRLTLDETLVVAGRVAAALGAAHGLGLVHRDLKPSNVFLPGGSVRDAKLIDFGVARTPDASVALTEPGSLIGTPSYMAPEQCRGEEVGPAADLFALGAVLFECATGHRAFDGGTIHAIFAKILFGTAPRARALEPAVPVELDALIAELLAADPAARPASAAVVGARLALDRPAVDEAVEGVSRAERHVVTVLVVADPIDISTLETATLSGAKPEDALMRVRDPLAAAATEVATLRDALVAVFRGGGAGDQAIRAAQAALAVRARAPGLVQHLVTGSVVTSSGVPGELVEQALAAAAAPGEIRVEAMAATLLEGRFVLERGAGGAGGEGGIALVAERALGRPRELLGRITPLVGRDGEWAALGALLDDSLAHGEPRGALLVGEAGLGKTRLLHELAERAVERGARVWSAAGDVLRGGALDLIGRAIGSSLGAGGHVALVEAIARHLPRERAIELAGALTAERAADLTVRDADLRADRVAAALLALIAAEAARAPIVLVLDDLHWSDAASVATVARVLRRVAGPVLVVAATRPPIGEAVQPLWSSPHVQVVELGPLGRRAQRALVGDVLGAEVGPELVEQMLELAQGNVLHLEELIRHVAGGTPRELPVTLAAALEVRLRALDDEHRRTLRAASVLGPEFAPAAVAHVLGEPAQADVDRRLARLVERELVSPVAGGGFRFRQHLLREAAYASLAEHDRRTGHRLAASWWMAQPHAAARTVADHLTFGDQRAAATGWYLRAAEEGLVASDHATALACARSGLATAVDAEARLSLLLVEAEALQWRGDEPERAFAAASEVRARARPGSLPWLRATRELAVLARSATNLDALVAIAGELEAVVTDHPGMHVMALSATLQQLFLRGRGGEIQAAWYARLERLSAGLEATDPRPAIWVEALQAMRFADLPGVSLRHSRRAMALAERAEAGRDLAWVSANLGLYLAYWGGADEAEPIQRRALELAERLELGPPTADARQNLGFIHLLLGRFDSAVALLERADDEYARAGNLPMQAATDLYRGRIALARGDAGRARTLAERALVRAPALAVIAAQAEALLARCARALGDADPLAHARAGHAHLAGGVPEGEMLVRLVLVDELLAHGLIDEARGALAGAVATLEALAATFDDPDERARFLALDEHAALRAHHARLEGH